MTIDCPSCNGSGEVALESSTGGMVDTPCTCLIGYSLQLTFVGPPEPTSAWLYDNEMDKHRAAMKEQGLLECWVCTDWHAIGEKCPIASKPTGWLAPEYRKGVNA